MATPKLTRAQLDMLHRLTWGPELVPGGQRDSGQRASNWYRTLDVLIRNGLATRETYGPAYITESGRALLQSATEKKEK